MSETKLVQALKQLRKGDGLTLGSIAMLADVQEVFGTDDYVAIRAAILDAVELERRDKCVAALANAYGIDCPPNTNLTERREQYVIDNKLAMRTLTNYEDFGALVLSQLIQLPVSSTTSGVDVALSVVVDMLHRTLSRAQAQDRFFENDDELVAIIGNLQRLYEAEDSLITDAHDTQLRALVDQVRERQCDLAGHPRASLANNGDEVRRHGAETSQGA